MTTFGHRYLAISFMIAQSAFRCSLLDTVCSVRSISVLGGTFGRAIGAFRTLSGLRLSANSSFLAVSP